MAVLDDLFGDDRYAEEEWLPIPGYEGYQASNCGRIKSMPRWVKREGHKSGPAFYAGKILTIRPNNRRGGYLYTELGRQGGTNPVHKLICLAFHGPKPEGTECCHVDGNNQNNLPENLVWGTREENRADSIRDGTIQHGEKHHNAKMTEDKVREMRKIYDAGGTSLSKLAKQFGLAVGATHRIVKRKAWKYVK